jgi:hypothetical protein
VVKSIYELKLLYLNSYIRYLVCPCALDFINLKPDYVTTCVSSFPLSSSSYAQASYRMQQPTLRNIRIRSTRDALQVLHGVAMNRLPLVTRRLDAEERRAIAPGNIYVW